jgi:hypothetical protein
MDLIIEQFELDMDILQSKYERVNEDLEFLIRKCDMKYIAESGTEDDLTALYTEANEQANEKKKNIFQKMIERIVAFIQKAISKIRANKDRINDNDVYEVKDISEHLPKIKSLDAELKSAIKSKKSDKIITINKKIKDFMISLGVGTAITVGAYTVSKKIKIPYKFKEPIDSSPKIKIVDSTGKEVKLRDDEIKRMMENHRNTMESLKSDIYKTDSMESLDEITEAIKNMNSVTSQVYKEGMWHIARQKEKILPRE